jgi:hypothetical protein
MENDDGGLMWFAQQGRLEELAELGVTSYERELQARNVRDADIQIVGKDDRTLHESKGDPL